MEKVAKAQTQNTSQKEALGKSLSQVWFTHQKKSRNREASGAMQKSEDKRTNGQTDKATC